MIRITLYERGVAFTSFTDVASSASASRPAFGPSADSSSLDKVARLVAKTLDGDLQ